MIAIKFDEEKVGHCIQAYKDERGKNPYLIMSEKTAKILPKLTNTIRITPDGTTIQYDNTPRSWNNCKILIDDDLEFGEVHIS